LSSAMKASSPPAEAPTIVMGKETSRGAFRTSGVLGFVRLVRRSLRRVFSDFGRAGEVAIGVAPFGH